MCDGETAELGSLGSSEWYRCRNCGWEFVSTDAEEGDDNPEE